MKTTNQELNEYNDSIPGRKTLKASNSILVIQPYFKNRMWVFDDNRVGLVEEPFVAGADTFIEYALKKKGKLNEGKMGFNLVFSLIPFKGHDYELAFQAHESQGSVYEVTNATDFRNALGTNQLWLCPALNLYFKDSPQKLYAQLNF